MQPSPPKTALVTGAGRRIGRAIALGLASAGWSVAVHYHASREEAGETCTRIEADGGTAIAVKADLADPAAAETLIQETSERLAPPELLVNNASVFRWDELHDLKTDQWDLHFAVNARAPVLLAQAFAKALPAQARGNIVNILDQRVWKPTPKYFSYALSKATMWNATRMLAQALSPRIRVNAIGPGPTLANRRQSAEQFAAQQAATLLGHGTDPDEIVKAIAFILDAPAVTGQMLALDGGQHLMWQTPDAALDT